MKKLRTIVHHSGELERTVLQAKKGDVLEPCEDGRSFYIKEESSGDWWATEDEAVEDAKGTMNFYYAFPSEDIEDEDKYKGYC